MTILMTVTKEKGREEEGCVRERLQSPFAFADELVVLNVPFRPIPLSVSSIIHPGKRESGEKYPLFLRVWILISREFSTKKVVEKLHPHHHFRFLLSSLSRPISKQGCVLSFLRCVTRLAALIPFLPTGSPETIVSPN